MKKLNNKGFAITTVIYGLAILGILLMAMLMSTMSQARTNNNDITRSIEDELNRFSQTETFFMGYLGEDNYPIPQEYIVPEGQSGWYRIELWGTQGGTAGGYGAYTSGIIKLTEGDVLYFYVGKQRANLGGVETDVRIVKGGYDESSSYQTRIMVAAGGGNRTEANGGTLYGYTASMNSNGGEVDASNEANTFGILPADKLQYSNGTLVGFPATYQKSSLGQTTAGGPVDDVKGGHGYYASNDETIGGVSFISGYAGSKAIVHGEVTNQPTYDYVPYTYNEETDEYEYESIDETIRYKFYDGIMLPGVQAGDGKAKIERLVVTTDEVTTLPRRNSKLNNVRYIKDCVEDGAETVFSAIAEVTYNKNPDVAFSKPITAAGNCKTVDLEGNYQLDEIAVWHVNGDGKDFKNHTIEVSANNTDWLTIKGLAPDTVYSETETVTGTHISAYQYDSTQEIPKVGNYYILPVLSENKVISANESAETDSGPIKIDNMNGLKRQIWAIELITDTNINPDLANKEYKITELSRNKALSIYEDENTTNNHISANAIFNTYARNTPQIWKVIPAGNGTYYIRTIENSSNPLAPSGNIFPQTNQGLSENYNNLLIGKNNPSTQRFRLISVDYSSNE